jgi:hypothetical protein
VPVTAYAISVPPSSLVVAIRCATPRFSPDRLCRPVAYRLVAQTARRSAGREMQHRVEGQPAAVYL